MTRAVMASRLPREVRVAGRRDAAVVCLVELIADPVADGVGVVASDFVDVVLAEVLDEDLEEVLEEKWDLWLLDLVLKGFAAGARVMPPSVFAAGSVLEVSVEIAREAALPAIAARSSDVARRRRSIYCTPSGRTILFGWVEVSEMTGAGSFCGAE
jgi:hypothetical protein